MTEQIENFKVNNSNWTKDIFKKCYMVYFSFASLQSLFYVPLTCTLGGWLPWTAPLSLPCHLISSWIVQKETLTVENRGPMKGEVEISMPLLLPSMHFFMVTHLLDSDSSMTTAFTRLWKLNHIHLPS